MSPSARELGCDVGIQIPAEVAVILPVIVPPDNGK